MGDDPVIGRYQRNAAMSGSDSRTHARKPSSCQSSMGRVARARAARKIPVEQEGAEERARRGADGQRRNAQLLYQQQAADDGAQVVDQRRYRLHIELLAHQQHRAKHAAGKEEQLRGQQNARELDAQRRLFARRSR